MAEKIIKITVQSEQALNRIVELTNALNTNAQSVDALNKSYSEGKITFENFTKQMAILKGESKAYKDEMRTLGNEIKNVIKQETEQLGYIQKLEAEVSNLTLKYKQLSESELKGAKGKEITETLTKKRAELQGLNEQYGNYTMNVGNYSSATKQMAINMSQVLREVPNFAMSARIGIMSLTNNLPMLAENIKQVAAEQKILNQQFKAGLIDTKPEGTVKMLVKSMIGLNGIMAAAMVLIQVFGPQLIDWVGSLFKAKDATDKLTESQLGLKSSMEISREAMKGGGEYKEAVANIEKLSVTLKAAKGNTELEKAAVDEYNKTLGVTFGKVTDVDSALKKINENEEAYIEAMKNMAFANAFFAQSAEDATKAMDVGLKSNAELVGGDMQKYVDAINKAKERLKQGTGAEKGTFNPITGKEYETKEQLQADFDNAVKAYNDAAAKERSKQIELIQKHQNKTLEEATKYYNKYAKAFKDNNWVVEDETKKTQTNQTKIAKEQEDERLKNIREYINNALSELNDKIKKPEAITLLQQQTEEGIKVLSNHLKKSFDAERENYLNFLSDNITATNNSLSAQLAAMNFQMQQELSVKELTEKQKAAITKKYQVIEADIRQSSLSSQLGLISDFVGNVGSLYKQGTKEQKRLQSAQIVIGGIISGFEAFNTAAYKSGIPVPFNYVAGGLAAAGVAAATGAAIKKVWAVDENGGASGAEAQKTTVTEKFHTGTYQPATKAQEQEITRTLLTTERILSPQQTGLFDSIVNNVQSLGGADSIVGGVGMNGVSQFDTMAAAFSVALQQQKAPVVIWKDYDDAMSKKAKFEQNRTL